MLVSGTMGFDVIIVGFISLLLCYLYQKWMLTKRLYYILLCNISIVFDADMVTGHCLTNYIHHTGFEDLKGQIIVRKFQNCSIHQNSFPSALTLCNQVE